MKLPLIANGRLFWKLFCAFWLSMTLPFVAGIIFVKSTGQLVPPPDAKGYLQLVHWATALAISLSFSFVLAWYIAKPLHHLRWALRRAANGRFDTRARPLMGTRKDEITDLAVEFDSMAARLQQLTLQRQQLFHDVSHEIRSPLARLQATIGLLQQNPAALDAMIERIERETARINTLIEELLTLHRLEAGSPGSPHERVDVIELLTAVAHDASFEASVKHCTVCFETEAAFVATLDGELVYRAFENVIRNAVKYTAANTVVDIEARVFEVAGASNASIASSTPTQMLEVKILDHGPGVALEFCEAIFEPFRRLEKLVPKALNGTQPAVPAVQGTGLGLAIAQRAISFHGGHISARPRECGGLCVVIQIPSSR